MLLKRWSFYQFFFGNTKCTTGNLSVDFKPSALKKYFLKLRDLIRNINVIFAITLKIFDMITRNLEVEIEKKLFGGKAIIIMGARQTGKTTLLKKITKNQEDVLWLNADEVDTIALFENVSSIRLKAIFAEKNRSDR